MFFEIDDQSFIKSVDFLKEIGTSAKIQLDFFKAITTLKIVVSNLKTDVTDQGEEEKKKIFEKTRKCFE